MRKTTYAQCAFFTIGNFNPAYVSCLLPTANIAEIGSPVNTTCSNSQPKKTLFESHLKAEIYLLKRFKNRVRTISKFDQKREVV